jgi:hypothetical protein
LLKVIRGDYDDQILKAGREFPEDFHHFVLQKSYPPPARIVRPPIRHDIHRAAAATGADEMPAPRDRREHHIIGEAERVEGERRRMQASRARAPHQETFEACVFKWAMVGGGSLVS